MRAITIITVVLVLNCVSGSYAAHPSFQGLWDLSGGDFRSVAYTTSADGTVVVGYGINPDGDTEGWIATIPEPTTLSLLLIGGMILQRRR